MADPMTNMEIEDVLSSIRRLVSEDLRPGFRAESHGEPVVTPDNEGKLVLTPAFRVTDTPPAARPDEAQVWRRAASRYRAPDLETDAGQSGADGAADRSGEQGETGFSELWSEGADTAASDSARTDDTRTDDAPTDDAPTEDAPTDDAAFVTVLDDDGSEPGMGFSTDSTIEDADFSDADIDGSHAAHSRAEDTLAGDSLAGDTLAEGARVGETQDGDRAVGQPDENDAPTGTEDSGYGGGSDNATLEAAIAELEAAVAASSDDWEPDGSEDAAGSHFMLPPMGHGRVLPEMAEAYGVAPDAADRGMRRLHLEPGDQMDDASKPVWADRTATAEPAAHPEAAPSMFADDEAVLDEGMLRELVIEVIRQELQGALGERITRNVRKLVRAEIHRAIAGREFE